MRIVHTASLPYVFTIDAHTPIRMIRKKVENMLANAQRVALAISMFCLPSEIRYGCNLDAF